MTQVAPELFAITWVRIFGSTPNPSAMRNASLTATKAAPAIKLLPSLATSPGAFEDAVRAEIGGLDIAGGGQDRDHHLARRGGLSRRYGAGGAEADGAIERRRHDVVGGGGKALLQQIGQHRQTHIAGADKCDVHDVLLISTGGIPPLGKCTGDGDQGRIAAAGAED